MPAGVAQVVGLHHPVGGNLPLVTEVPLHHVSDLQVGRNADVSALRGEDRGAGERVAGLAVQRVARERIGELSAGTAMMRRDVGRIGGPALGIEQLGGVVHQDERRADGLLAVALGIPDQAEAGRERGPVGRGERLAVGILRGIAGEDQARRSAWDTPELCQPWRNSGQLNWLPRPYLS